MTKRRIGRWVMVMVPVGFMHAGIISRHWFRWTAMRRAREYARNGIPASVWDWRWPFYDRLGDNGFLCNVRTSTEAQRRQWRR